MLFFIKIIRVLIVSLTCSPAFIVISVAEETKLFTIGTGGTTYTYHPVGGMIANAVSRPPGSLACEEGGSCGVDNLIAVGVSSLGSIENVDAVISGQRNSGFAQSDIAYWMYTGTGIMGEEAPRSELRVIAALYEEHIHLVTLEDAGINNIYDLLGKRVSLDAPGSGTYVDAKLILEANGLQTGDYISIALRGAAAAKALKEGKIDAFFVVAGYPTDFITDLAKDTDINLVPIDGEAADELIAEYAFFSINNIPAGAYTGVDEIFTLSVGALWVTSAREEDDLIHSITSALWNEKSRKLLNVGHARGRDITLKTSLLGIGVPLHPGAERFYKEVGMLD